ncbi:hypothetical protein HZS_3043 [Henneguya salminicola]|nr:hypothetical protein HZS_3043 [Henneguya salminicola]
MDKFLICKRKYNVGRILQTQDQWIRGGVDSMENSIIWTDGWTAYRHLGQLGFHHQVVVHSRQFITVDGVHTNRIKAMWEAVTRKFRHITNKKKAFSNSYLAEYLLKGRILSQFLMTIKELYPIENDKLLLISTQGSNFNGMFSQIL